MPPMIFLAYMVSVDLKNLARAISLNIIAKNN